MKWSQYDLDFRAQCISMGIKPPSKPEAMYAWDAGKPCMLDPANPAWYDNSKRTVKEWGKNYHAEIKWKDYTNLEEYWEAVRKNAANNLNALCNRYRNEQSS